ncbi:MAG: MerR [Pseudonocardia sp.]|nr:MerR [Pseudonocardia sp.]
MTTYDVTVTRDDDAGAWVALIDGLPPHLVGATQVERFTDLDVEVRDLIAGLTDTDPDDFNLRWHHRWGDQDVTALLIVLDRVEHAAAQITAERDAVRRAVIVRGKAAKLSQRVIADAIGLSHQRVNQLAKTATDEDAEDLRS